MRKRWLLTLIVPFLFAIMTGFSTPQDPSEMVEKKTVSDSLTVNLKFENPNLVVKDQRNFDVLERILQDRNQSENEIAQAINNITGLAPYLLRSQERRYESTMDRLRRNSGYSTSEINKFIAQKRLSEIISSVVLIVSILIFVVMNAFVNNRIDYRVYILKLLTQTIFLILLFVLLQYVLFPSIFKESYEFHSLMSLLE